MGSTKVGAGLLYHAAFRWVIGPRFCSEWAACEGRWDVGPLWRSNSWPPVLLTGFEWGVQFAASTYPST